MDRVFARLATTRRVRLKHPPWCRRALPVLGLCGSACRLGAQCTADDTRSCRQAARPHGPCLPLVRRQVGRALPWCDNTHASRRMQTGACRGGGSTRLVERIMEGDYPSQVSAVTWRTRTTGGCRESTETSGCTESRTSRSTITQSRRTSTRTYCRPASESCMSATTASFRPSAVTPG